MYRLPLAVLFAPALLAFAPPAPQADEERRQIAAASALGTSIYQLDRAAWVATDALTAKLPRDRLSGAGGWVIERGDGGDLIVTFYRGAGDAARAFFVADVRQGEVRDSRMLAAPEAMTPAQLRLVRAQEAAKAEAEVRNFRPCTAAPFNTVVLPASKADGPILVYLLSAQVENGTYPLGGHYRIVIGPDGRAGPARAFTRTCLNMKAGRGPKGETPAFLVVSHLLDPTPTEAHVFSSFAARIPLLVVTATERIWEVKGSSIAASKMKVPAPAS